MEQQYPSPKFDVDRAVRIGSIWLGLFFGPVAWVLYWYWSERDCRLEQRYYGAASFESLRVRRFWRVVNLSALVLFALFIVFMSIVDLIGRTS